MDALTPYINLQIAKSCWEGRVYVVLDRWGRAQEIECKGYVWGRCKATGDLCPALPEPVPEPAADGCTSCAPTEETP